MKILRALTYIICGGAFLVFALLVWVGFDTSDSAPLGPIDDSYSAIRFLDNNATDSLVYTSVVNDLKRGDTVSVVKDGKYYIVDTTGKGRKAALFLEVLKSSSVKK